MWVALQIYRYNLIPQINEYITQHGKRDFADMIKLRTLKLGDNPVYPSGPV